MRMDVQVNSNFIKAERDKRAWSQEQLAAAAGIGLRTIQRIESTGVASNETVMSLAAVFECSLDDLRAVTTKPAPSWKSFVVAGIVVVCSALGIALITTQAQAKEVMLDVIFKSSETSSSTFKMITTEDKGTEVRLEKEAKLVFVPTLQDNDLILITVDIYGYDGTDFKLMSQPKVQVRNGHEARIQVGIEGGRIFDIKIKPHLI